MRQKGFAQILILGIILIGLAAGIYAVGQFTNLLPKAKEVDTPSAQVVKKIPPVDNALQNIDTRMPDINNKQDLENSLHELDNTSTDALDQGTSENESDSSQF